MIELDTIYNEDCLTGMQRIPDGSVDCIICDLPYEVLNKGNADAQWDRLIPMEPLWEQYKRVTKPNAAIVLFCQGMFTARLMMSQPKMWRYNLIWDKTVKTGFLNARRMPLRQHEDICVFYRELPTYNPQMTKGEKHQRHPKSKKEKESNRCYGDFPTKEPTVSDEMFPSSIIGISKGNSKEIWQHPTQKPVDLIAYLIRTYSNPGDTILDNTIGSGTTAVAALREKRHFIGFELNRDYYDIALRRIKLEQQQQTLF